MSTREHEFWLELIDDQPSFTTVLLQWAGIGQLPPFTQVRVDSGDLAEYDPTEYRADKVVSFYTDPMDKLPVLAVIVESQRKYVDEKHPPTWGQTYLDNVLAVQPEHARRLLEMLMTTRTHEYKSDFFRRAHGEGKAEGKVEGKAEGKVEGEAKAILGFLTARGLPVSDEARARITSCTDLDQLDTWIQRAPTVESVADLFD